MVKLKFNTLSDILLGIGVISILFAVIVFFGQIFILSLQQFIGINIIPPDFAVTTGMPFIVISIIGGFGISILGFILNK